MATETVKLGFRVGVAKGYTWSSGGGSAEFELTLPQDALLDVSKFVPPPGLVAALINSATDDYFRKEAEIKEREERAKLDTDREVTSLES